MTSSLDLKKNLCTKLTAIQFYFFFFKLILNSDLNTQYCILSVLGNVSSEEYRHEGSVLGLSLGRHGLPSLFLHDTPNFFPLFCFKLILSAAVEQVHILSP